MKFPTILALTLSTAFLATCGGGGSGRSAPASPVTSLEISPVQASYINYFNGSLTLPFTLSGTVAGIPVSGSGTVTQSSVSSTTFEGATALQKTTTINGFLTANGLTKPLASTLVSYVDPSYMPLGSINSEYLAVTGNMDDTGEWFSTNSHSSSSKITLLDTEAVSYALQPDTASTALLRIIQADMNLSGATTMSSSLNFRMSPAGGHSRLSEHAAAHATDLTLTY